ncbi:MAG TPA: universal stress protein [Acidimicrobiia bacterium]|nr:universal stress protein [Acidimicrobiia bacterium]
MVVVAGVDSSAHAVKVLGRALDEARRRQAELHVVHVFNPPMIYMEVPIDMGEMADGERKAVWSQLEASLSGAGVPVTRVDLEGYPPDVLVAYATDVDASVLVLGTRGRGEFASLILGSTSHRAIQLATCDVLVVKPDRESPTS